jgi:hypothetical protein
MVKPIVVFTGTFETVTREQAKLAAEHYGWDVSGQVNSKTSLLVTGLRYARQTADSGRRHRIDQALELGIPICSEAEFFDNYIRRPLDWIAKTEPNTKDTNPKDGFGVRKWRQYATVPVTVLWEVGVGMLEGAFKYGRHNYRVAGVRASVYVDAAKGHIDQWWEGEDIDKDSGLNHITKAICSLVVLRDAMIQNMLNDDRPPKANLDRVRDEMQAVVDQLFEKYPDPEQPFTQIREMEQAVAQAVASATGFQDTPTWQHHLGSGSV